MSAENEKVCSNCRHCVRAKDGEYNLILCHCEIHNRYMSYAQVMEGWCKHWAKDTELAPNKDGVKTELEGET